VRIFACLHDRVCSFDASKGLVYSPFTLHLAARSGLAQHTIRLAPSPSPTPFTPPRCFHCPCIALGALLLAGAVAVPLLLSLLASVSAGLDADAWAALAAHAQTAPALWVSAYTGVVASALAWAGSALLLS